MATSVIDESFLPLRKHIEQFVPLKDTDWQLLEPHLTVRTIRKHDFMIREGSIGREVGYVLEGEMRHFYTHAGEEKTTYFYFENAQIGRAHV